MKKNRIVGLVVTVAAMLLLYAGSVVAGEKEHTLKVGKKGDITFDRETRVGDLTLKPGRYFFQHRTEGEDHFVHFTEVTKASPYSTAVGGAPKAHPGEVKCQLETLPSKLSRTTLFYNDEGGVRRLTRIEVAGENVAHLF